jgi:transcriptional regulator with XRE-family HTH domain
MVAVKDNVRSMPPKKPINAKTYLGRFATRLRALREGAGLSVDEVVERLNAAGIEVKARAVYSWEQGQTTPQVPAIPVLAKIYQLESPGELFPKR